MGETWTILKVLQWTTEYFAGKGIEQPRADAEVLLAHVLRVERIQLYLRFDQPLAVDELAAYKKLLRRRALREPTQYITGKQEFWSLEFNVSPSVLIPRPETEILVERASDYIGKSSAHVLDLGTGSGAVAVSLAHECPSISITAVDKSLEALWTARQNAIKHHVASRISFVASDLFSAFKVGSARWDLIVTNPPYIGDEEFQSIAPEVAIYEPREALEGHGPQGLGIIDQILRKASYHLKPGGRLLMEFGFNQSEPLEQRLLHLGFLRQSFQFIRDYSGILRVLDLSVIDR